MEPIFGMILVAIVAVVTWCVASEGVWGAGLTFLCVLFAGILAMNFFEPIAGYLDGIGYPEYSDLVALVGLFALFTFLGRLATDNISPTEIEFDSRVYQAGRWLFALATGYTTMAILLTALHTAPLPRDFLGFHPDRKNFFDIRAPDREWLGFTQHVSEKVLPWQNNVFDGWRHDAPGTDQKLWPSFPIRYATRRKEGAAKIGPAAPAPVAPGGHTGPAGF